MVLEGKAKRVGLLATQGIRGGTNRRVLDRITKEGKIFMAWSDRNWVLDGANVHVSIIGFDNGSEPTSYLDNQKVSLINPDLSSGVNVVSAYLLKENEGIGFQGVVLRGSFDILEKLAKQMTAVKNASGANNGDVIKRRMIGQDITVRTRNGWVIDFGVEMSEEDAKKYEWPYKYCRDIVYHEREKAAQKEARERWWIHWRPRKEMREAIAALPRYIATPRVGKHRIFAWVDSKVLPDNALVIFARSDDYYFGVLHSCVHEMWARRKGTQLRERESGFRYSVEFTFDTFPFPWPPGGAIPLDKVATHKLIEQTAQEIVAFRDIWMNPEGVGIIFSSKKLKERTLTNLYNALRDYRGGFKGKEHNELKWSASVKGIISLAEIESLDYLHNKLDEAVLKAYELSPSASSEEIFLMLMGLNAERAKSSGGKDFDNEDPDRG